MRVETAPARALAPGDYEAGRQLRAGRLGAVGLVLLTIAGGLSLTEPIEGIPVLGYLATLCVLAGLSCLAPICIVGRRSRRRERGASGTRGVIREIAIDHASRNPGRNGVTVSALMVGLAIMIGVLVMVRSFRHTVEVWVADTVLSDVVVAPSLWLRGTEAGSIGRSLPPSWLQALSGIPGVEAVDTYRDVRINVDGRRVAIVSRDLRLHARTEPVIVLRKGDSSEQLNRAADIGGVLISEVLADRLGVKEGSLLEVTTPEGIKKFPVVAVFYDYSTDGGKLVIDRTLYQSLWHDELVTVFPVYLAAGADADQVRKTIVEKLGEANQREAPPVGHQQHRTTNGDPRDLRPDISDDLCARSHRDHHRHARYRQYLSHVGAGAPQRVCHITGDRRQRQADSGVGAVGSRVSRAGGDRLGLDRRRSALVPACLSHQQTVVWVDDSMIMPIGPLMQAVGLAAAATLVAGYFPARWAARQSVAEGLRRGVSVLMVSMLERGRRQKYVVHFPLREWSRDLTIFTIRARLSSEISVN
ncbi:MAG: ABC transporter permease [Nitrospiraceae bacterium]|nr:ABC transporter permease [Nitrospiraceae bacterium]